MNIQELKTTNSAMQNTNIMTGWRRILLLQKTAQEYFLSGILLHKPENIFYYTSVFTHEPSFLLVPASGEPELVVSDPAGEEAGNDSLVPVVKGGLDIAGFAYERMLQKKMFKSPPVGPVDSFLRKIGESPLGIELDYMDVFLFQYLEIRNHKNISGEVAAQREIKDSFEIENISRACETADAAMEYARDRIYLGMSEKELSGIFDARAKYLGAEESKCRVRSGANTARSFSRRMEGEVVRGPLLVDYGARVGGYWSDITRMFYLGSEPDSFFLETYNLVLEARKKALECMYPGRSMYGPEAEIKEIFRAGGYLQNMVNTPGHGLGLEVHEQPVLAAPAAKGQNIQETPAWAKDSLATALSDVLQDKGGDSLPRFRKGQVFALEPGLYFSELGVRIEDVVHISDKPRFLSTYPASISDLVVPL